MGLPEARAAWQTLRAELNALPASYEKLNILGSILNFATKQKDTVKAALKATPATNISQLPSYVVLDELGNSYDIDKATGTLTKR